MSPRVDVAADVRSARELVTLGSVRFGDADAQPEQVLRWAAEQVGLRQLAIATSLADTVLAHVATRGARGGRAVRRSRLPLRRTRGLRDAVAQGLRRQPAHAHAGAHRRQQGCRGGSRSSSRATRTAAARCARWRRSTPPSPATAPGRLACRDDHNGRAGVEVVTLDAKRDMVKAQPAGPLDPGPGRRLRGGALAAGEPAAPTRLPLHRVRAVHAPVAEGKTIALGAGRASPRPSAGCTREPAAGLPRLRRAPGSGGGRRTGGRAQGGGPGSRRRCGVGGGPLGLRGPAGLGRRRRAGVGGSRLPSGDLAGAWFAVAATGSAAIDDLVAAEADDERVG